MNIFIVWYRNLDSQGSQRFILNIYLKHSKRRCIYISLYLSSSTDTYKYLSSDIFYFRREHLEVSLALTDLHPLVESGAAASLGVRESENVINIINIVCRVTKGHDHLLIYRRGPFKDIKLTS